MNRRHFVFVLLILLLALAVRAAGLVTQSLWYDEGYTVMFSQRAVGDIITGAAQRELNTPLHYVTLKAWMALAGQSEFSIRLLSVFAGVTTVALAYRLSKLALSQSSLIPALLVALSPVGVIVSQEVRMYALAACLCVASTVSFIRVMRSNQRRQWFVWMIVSIAAFGTHVLAAFVIATQILLLLFAWRSRRIFATRDRAGPVAVAIISFALVTWTGFILLNSSTYGTTYGGRLEFAGTLAQSMAAQFLPRLQPSSLIAPMAFLAVLITALVVIRLFARPDRFLAYIWLIGLFSITAIASFSAITGKFSSRYPALIAPLFTAALGITLADLANLADFAGAAGARARSGSNASRSAVIAATNVLLAGFVFGLVQLRINPIYANEDFRGAAAYIRAHMQPDETALLVSGHFAPVFEYYFGSTGWTALPNDPVLNVNNTLDYESAVPPSNTALQGKGGAWLLLWQDDVIDPTGLAPALLRRQSENLAPTLDTRDFNGLRLQRYRFFQPYQALPERLPPTQSRIEVNRVQRGLSSLGCYQPQWPRAGDGWIEAQCFWQVKPFVPLSVYTQVSLRLFDRAGKQVVQSDQPIAPNGMPFVPFEKPILGAYFIELPRALAAGEYMLRVIPYTETEEIAPQVVTPIRILP